MKKQTPPDIDDTWHFRGQMMKNVMKLYEGEYRWHKIQNCPRCKLKKGIKPCLFGMPTAEAAHSGKWAIMGCTLEEPSPKWACVRCNYKIYYPPDCLERDW